MGEYNFIYATNGQIFAICDSSNSVMNVCFENLYELQAFAAINSTVNTQINNGWKYDITSSRGIKSFSDWKSNNMDDDGNLVTGLPVDKDAGRTSFLEHSKAAQEYLQQTFGYFTDDSDSDDTQELTVTKVEELYKTLKVAELRAVAKDHGCKNVSKARKQELKEMLLEKCTTRDAIKFAASDFEDCDKRNSIVINCLDYMTHLEEMSDQPERLFIDGEYDSNQTLFEKKSNSCKIGVLAKNEQVGYALLHLLRIIIDNNYDLIDVLMENVEEQDFYTPAEIFAAMADKETEYTTIYSVGQKIVNVNEKVIKRSTIDTWSLSRIRGEFTQ